MWTSCMLWSCAVEHMVMQLKMAAAKIPSADCVVLRRMLFAKSFLPPKMPLYWEMVARFAGSSESVESVKITMDNLEVLNPEAFISDAALTKELIEMDYKITKQPIGVVLIPPEVKCPHCGGDLSLRGDRPSRLTLYSETLGTVPATHFHKLCRNTHKGCSFVQYYGYHKSKDGSLTYNWDWKSLTYIICSQETGFEISMLSRYDVELLIGQLTYKQKADIYNVSHGCDTTIKTSSQIKEETTNPKSSVHGADKKRRQMDRRRFEAAHLKYTSLQVAAWYPDVINQENVKFETSITDTLTAITPTFFESFESQYAAHACGFPGCGSVLVMDGNIKNRRDVCYAKDAGFISFTGLDGSIKTGCTATPSFKSRYCSKHFNLSCEEVTEHDIEESDTVSRLVNSNKNPGKMVAEMILAKKDTRNQSYYQVRWLGCPECFATWEPAASVPKKLIDMYEAGIKSDTVVESSHQFGHLTSTLTVKHDDTTEHEPKRLRQDRPCPTELEGIFQEKVRPDLNCKTEKDRHVRLNHRTAGILAGMWPCGVITFIREMFIAESKSQVYGHLHHFLQNNSEMASNLEFICYDDGCHLKKYADNKCRCDLTSITKVLSQLHIVIDKMHMSGHVDKWCKESCDPYMFDELAKVDTEACEQVFSWLSRYKKMTQKMNRHTFVFFILYICELHNRREMEKLQRGNFL